MKSKQKLIVEFFKETNSIKEPVREWLKSLSISDKKIIGHDLMVMQYNWPIGMPLVRYLGKRLWELRSTLDNRIARVIFVIQNDHIILLHGFIKKTQKTPIKEINIAIIRLNILKKASKD